MLVCVGRVVFVCVCVGRVVFVCVCVGSVVFVCALTCVHTSYSEQIVRSGSDGGE